MMGSPKANGLPTGHRAVTTDSPSACPARVVRLARALSGRYAPRSRRHVGDLREHPAVVGADLAEVALGDAAPAANTRRRDS